MDLVQLGQDTNRKPPDLTACEYGPIAFGAFSVKIISLGIKLLH
jgi:hypothetical protein